MTTVKLLHAAAAVIALCGTARAADITLEAPDGRLQITVRGQIEPGDDKKFLAVALNVNRPVPVALNSGGGYLEQAMNIGRITNAFKYKTTVRAGTMCLSACAIVWLSGVERELGNRAFIGFHSARKNKDTWERHVAGNIAVAEYLTKLGLPKEVIELAGRADPNKMLYLDRDDAVAWGLIKPDVTAAR